MEKLEKLLQYLAQLQLTADKAITVVDGTHASDRLKSASGRQIVVSYPDLKQVGTCSDVYTDELSAAVFIIEKAMGASRTEEQELEQYVDILKTAEKLVTKLRCDTTGGTHCPLLLGMSIRNINVVPVYNIYGGWGGWLVEVDM